MIKTNQKRKEKIWAHTRFKNWWTSIFQSKTQSVFVQAVQIERIHDGPFDFRHAATYFYFEVLKQTRHSDELDVQIYTIFVRKGDHHKETTRRIISIQSKLGTCRNNPPATPNHPTRRKPVDYGTITCNNELRHAGITHFRICNLLCIYQYL